MKAEKTVGTKGKLMALLMAKNSEFVLVGRMVGLSAADSDLKTAG